MALKYLYVPSGYKGGSSSGTAYGVLPNVANADLAFVRGSAGTRINADGLIESMVTNVPRLDYTDGSCPTLLTEPERTNLVVNSAGGYHPDTVPFTNTSAPDGTNTAQIPTPFSNFNRYEHIISAGSATGDTKLTYSWYRKRLSTPSIPTFTGDLKVLALVNCIQVGNTIQIDSNVGGYDRFSATFDVIDGSLEAKIRLYYGELIGVGNSSIAYFGHQVEVGEHATSYIPTSGAIETRSADTGIVTSDLSSYINSTEGVLEVKISRFEGIPSTEQSWISLSASETNDDNSVSIGFTGLNTTLAHFIKSSDVDVTTPTTSQVTEDLSQMNVIKLKWKDGDFQAKIGNTTIDLSAGAGSLPFASTLKYLRIGYPNYSGGAFKGNIQYIKVYDSATDF